jgi:hypothetical protein
MNPRALSYSLLLTVAVSAGSSAEVQAKTWSEWLWGSPSPVKFETVDASKVARDAYCDVAIAIESLRTRHIDFKGLNYDADVSLRVLSGTKSEGETGGQVIVTSQKLLAEVPRSDGLYR